MNPAELFLLLQFLTWWLLTITSLHKNSSDEALELFQKHAPLQLLNFV